MRWIYLSPHLDDAIISCGGLIYKQIQAETDVEIWNLMSGIPPSIAPLSELARTFQAGWGTNSAKETLRLRLKEDQLAALCVGARPSYFDFLDCIYRCDENNRPLYSADIFVPPHVDDMLLIEDIASILGEKILDEDILVCPLALGSHPDHVIVRDAAERIRHPLRYYADLPYLLRYPEAISETTENLVSEICSLSEIDLLAWQEAIAAYETQLMMLFGSKEIMLSEIEQYWQTNRGIQLWKIRKKSS
jgi:LmbE family N-acetylglucosaminyl deacetylase